MVDTKCEGYVKSVRTMLEPLDGIINVCLFSFRVLLFVAKNQGCEDLKILQVRFLRLLCWCFVNTFWFCRLRGFGNWNYAYGFDAGVECAEKKVVKILEATPMKDVIAVLAEYGRKFQLIGQVLPESESLLVFLWMLESLT